MTRRWVVGKDDGRTVAEIVARLPGEGDAIRQGRVFLGPRRVAEGDEPVALGDEITVEAPRGPEASAAVRVLGERGDVLAVYKPAGLPTEPDRSGSLSLVESVARLVSVPARALHAATRLDASVTGIVLLGRGALGARTLDRAMREGRIERQYAGLAAGNLSPSAGTFTGSVGKGRRGAQAGGAGARAAATAYEVLAQIGAPPDTPVSLVRFRPLTGRLHQIRVHASTAGAPLLGDVAHGGPGRWVLPSGRVLPLPRVMLHAARVVLRAPEAEWCVRTPPPADFEDVWLALGGDAAALAAATPPCGSA